MLCYPATLVHAVAIVGGEAGLGSRWPARLVRNRRVSMDQQRRRRGARPARPTIPAARRDNVDGSGMGDGPDVVISRICMSPSMTLTPASFTSIVSLVNEKLVGTFRLRWSASGGRGGTSAANAHCDLPLSGARLKLNCNPNNKIDRRNTWLAQLNTLMLS